MTTYDPVWAISEENKQKIKEIMRRRNIEIYVYGFLPYKFTAEKAGIDPKSILIGVESEQKRFLGFWNFATKIYTTANLDKNEFRRVINEWKR